MTSAIMLAATQLGVALSASSAPRAPSCRMVPARPRSFCWQGVQVTGAVTADSIYFTIEWLTCANTSQVPATALEQTVMQVVLGAPWM
jgi:hypothetical protein